jgi:hypothetical protein
VLRVEFSAVSRHQRAVTHSGVSGVKMKFAERSQRRQNIGENERQHESAAGQPVGVEEKIA